MAADGRCVWLYAVIDDMGALPAGELTGVGASMVRPLQAAGLAAIVSDVDQREFGEAALRRNLEDLRWLERTARAHHAVIEAVATRCPVVPMRLATVYRSDISVLTMLGDRAMDLRDALSRIGACREWGVKAFVALPTDPGPTDPGPTDPGPADRGSAAPGSAGKPGTAYLQRRKAQLTSRADARQEAGAEAGAVHAELSRLSAAARLYPPQAPRLAGQTALMVLNAAYLVPDERAGEFAAAVNDLTGRFRSVRLGLTGPWPAYSFVGEHDRTEL
jgi:Gas vesicle synthesis protein GvpL/GvpF